MKPDYSERYNLKLQKKYLWNFTVLREYIVGVLGVDKAVLGQVLKRCSDYHYGRIKNITKFELKVYEYIVSQKLSPQRVRNWYLSSRLPEDIKHDLIEGRISQKKAICLAKNKELGKELSLTWRMMELIRKTVSEVL
ncbi:hypothetical protein HYV79_02985 [Candidatus Woesearchaeota archaeon]|nr:hypothetical protein [Candidatus Woesearchaeota archaeon]